MKKNSLKILGLLCRIEKSAKNCQKTSLKILGLLCRIEKSAKNCQKTYILRELLLKIGSWCRHIDCLQFKTWKYKLCIYILYRNYKVFLWNCVFVGYCKCFWTPFGHFLFVCPFHCVHRLALFCFVVLLLMLSSFNCSFSCD